MSWCLCCAEAEVEEEEVDRVQLAFQRMDINRDGHVTYAEFRKVTTAMDSEGVNEISHNIQRRCLFQVSNWGNCPEGYSLMDGFQDLFN